MGWYSCSGMRAGHLYSGTGAGIPNEVLAWLLTLRPGAGTYTQVPGVQLHLLLQLCEQLCVERLQLQAGEKTQLKARLPQKL